MKAGSFLAPYFLSAWGMRFDEDVPIELIHPRQLLRSERFDLAFKLFYIDSYVKGTNIEEAKNLYLKHISAFTDGTFCEPGDDAKQSAEAYVECFNAMIDSIRREGFDSSRSAVPIGPDGVIVNGSHRTAIAIYFNIELPVFHLNQSIRFDHNFFISRGVSDIDVQTVIPFFLRFAENIDLTFVWPVAKTKDHCKVAERFVEGSGAVLYRKDFTFSFSEFRRLIAQLYCEQCWAHSNDFSFDGVTNKASLCYSGRYKTTCYILCGTSPHELNRIKSGFRAALGIGKHSCHSTDTRDEALFAWDLLFNPISYNFNIKYGIAVNRNLLARLLNRGELSFFAEPYSSELAEELANPKPTDPFYDLQNYSFGSKPPGSNPLLLTCCKTCFYCPEDIDSLFLKFSMKLSENYKPRINTSSNWLGRLVFWRMARITRRISKKLRGFTRTAWFRFFSFKTIDSLRGSLAKANQKARYLIMGERHITLEELWEKGREKDIDLLCESRQDVRKIVKILRALPQGERDDGMHYVLFLNHKRIELDFRVIGDAYFDPRWARHMIDFRVLRASNVYTMCDEDYRFSMVYHYIYQKPVLSVTHIQLLRQCFGDQTLECAQFELLLACFMKKNGYYYVDAPNSFSIARLNPTFAKGRTKIYSGTQPLLPFVNS